MVCFSYYCPSYQDYDTVKSGLFLETDEENPNMPIEQISDDEEILPPLPHDEDSEVKIYPLFPEYLEAFKNFTESNPEIEINPPDNKLTEWLEYNRCQALENFHHIILEGNLELVKEILESVPTQIQKQFINMPVYDAHCGGALHEAVLEVRWQQSDNINLEIIKYFLDKGADTKMLDYYYDTPEDFCETDDYASSCGNPVPEAAEFIRNFQIKTN